MSPYREPERPADTGPESREWDVFDTASVIAATGGAATFAIGIGAAVSSDDSAMVAFAGALLWGATILGAQAMRP